MVEELLEQQGYPPAEAQARARQFSFGFEPGDIVSTVMSFGSPTPVEVLVLGPEREAVRKNALKVLAEMKKIPSFATCNFTSNSIIRRCASISIARRRA